MTTLPVISTSLNYPCRRGKVRDVYDLGTQLLIVSTDRISAFDWVLPSGIPDKGSVLTSLSSFWFELLNVEHHLISTDVPSEINPSAEDRQLLSGRIMVAKKADVIPYECVVRGYLEGSGWREYQKTGAVCGIRLPAGLQQCEKLPEPIFTPATKVDDGHDENVSFETMANDLGSEVANRLRDLSLDVYSQGCKFAEQRGVLIADTKFEWGWNGGRIILIDEVLTPDSSRFWPADRFSPGKAQPSYDKQFVREWLDGSDWDKQCAPPDLPEDIIAKTREKYLEVHERLTGKQKVD